MSTVQAPDPECEAPPVSGRPDDLIPVREAAAMVDRGYSTLRAWVRAGELTGYHEDPDNPYNSKLMVSRSELFTFMAAHEKPTLPARPPKEPPETAAAPAERPRDGSGQEVAKLREDIRRVNAEMALLRADLRVATLEKESAHALLEAVRGTVAALDGRVRDLQALSEAERARALAAEAERDALKTAAGIPWWRRLLAAPTSSG